MATSIHHAPMENNISDFNKFIREFLGLFLFFWAVLLFLALISFDATDPSFNLVNSSNIEIRNMAGLFGSYASGFLNDFFGIGAFIWPAVFAGLGWAYISSRYVIYWWRWCGLFLLTLCLLTAASAFDINLGDLTGGGMVGNTLHLFGTHYLSPIGTALIWLFLFLTGIQLTFNFSWIGLYQYCKDALVQKLGSERVEQQKIENKPAGFLKRLVAKIQALKRNEKQVPEKAASSPVINLKPDTQAAPQAAQAATSDRDNKNQTGKPASFINKTKTSIGGFAQAGSAKIKNALTGTGKFIKTYFRWPKKGKQSDGSAELQFPPLSLQIQGETAPDTQAAPVQDVNIRIIGELPKQQKEETRLAAPSANIPKTAHVPVQAASAVEATRLFPAPPPSEASEKDHFPLPSPQLLVPAAPLAHAVQEDFASRGQALMACFNDFGIQGELVRITPGPVITMYEVRPAPGVRVSRIVNLGDDLSLALKAIAIRIQPVPGSNTIGIEIPNTSREIVNFRELVESSQFQEGAGPLTIILGKNISGKPYMTDLTKMPHLLVGGTTGAGKSVSLNAMLISLLYKLQPDELKLLLIDPKRVEMAVYADLPHLVHPVVTEMADAKTALEWAIHEMQTRFDTIKELGVRNVAAYNQRLASFGNNPPEAYAHLRPIPYLVIVIDELADLMMTAAREVESSILRLLQLARAAAIHLILATQRPSVDVVTGLLKANLNCRVAFQVISRHDSRTILDETGAEHLLGKGDMLFKPPAGALQRLHAPFLTDDEIQTVVNYWKQQKAPNYAINFAKWSAESPNSTGSSSGSDASSDALYADARAFVLEQGRASISLLQRHLKIGFNRAARLMEQFEKDGIISPADGSKPRTVIKS